MSQSEEELPLPHCPAQNVAALPLCTVQYPPKTTNENQRKEFKQKLLKENPETLFGDLYKTGGVSNLIFYSDYI